MLASFSVYWGVWQWASYAWLAPCSSQPLNSEGIMVADTRIRKTWSDRSVSRELHTLQDLVKGVHKVLIQLITTQ